MVQTDLKSDNFCGYNTSAAPFFWILDPVQNNIQFNAGEVGVFSGVGLHTPAQVIDVSSMIVEGGRDSYLTSCVPPVPPLPSKYGYETDNSIRKIGPKLTTQGFDNRQRGLEPEQLAKYETQNVEHFNNLENNKNVQSNIDFVNTTNGTRATIVDKATFLLPEFTKNKRSASDYSGVDWQAGFSGNASNLYTNPQLLTNVIERMALERGGLDQNQVIKQSQEPWVNNTYEKGPHGPTNLQGKEQMPTCEKIRQPYNTKFPFGLPTDPKTGKPLKEKESVNFNPIDITSIGISSPVLNQNPSLPFNYNAVYPNGGCNKVSFLQKDNNKMCSDNDNDLTGVNSFNYLTDIPPSGIYPIKTF